MCSIMVHVHKNHGGGCIFFNMRFRIIFLQLLLLSFCIYSFFFSLSNRRKFAEGHMVCAEKLKDVPCTYSPQAIMKSNA